MHFYPVVDETGRVVSMVRYARDITQQKRIEEQIRNAEKLASVGQLAAGIAHEINNPLGVILCHTDLLKRQLQSEPQALSDVGTIEKHTLNCKRIVSDLLKFARGESGSMQLKAVNHVIEEAAGMLAHQFSRQGISIDLDLAPDLPLLAMDEERLKQVFVNLLVNARQAMEEGGVMGIASRYLPASRQIELRFRDTGKGIPPEIQKRIFDPFFSTKDSSEGTGIGLSVSYGIVRDHRGEILVQSEPGLWTEFTVLLPVSEGA
jgi:signal transduction histidine kinase